MNEFSEERDQIQQFHNRDIQGEMDKTIREYTHKFLLETVPGVTKEMFARQLYPYMMSLVKQTLSTTPAVMQIRPVPPPVVTEADLISKLIMQMSPRSPTFTSYESKLFEALLAYQLKITCKEASGQEKRPRDDDDAVKDSEPK